MIQIDVPKAPGLGLLLERVHYDWYDRKFKKTHQPLSEWPEAEVSLLSLNVSVILFCSKFCIF